MDSIKDAIPHKPEMDAFDWRTSWRRAKHAVAGHVPLIVASCVISMLLLVVYLRTFPPIYKGEVVLQAEANEDVVRSNYYAAWNVFRRGDLKSEPELMTSARVASKVVAALDLKFTDVHHTFLTHLGYLWTDSWIGRGYRSFKEWVFPPDSKAYKATPEEIERARTIDAFREGVAFEPLAGTAVGKVIVRAPTFRAAEFANKVVEVYLAERGDIFLGEADAAYKSLQGEVVRAAAALAAIDKEKYDFDIRNKMVLDFEKDKLLVTNMVALQTMINDIKANISGLEAGLQTIEQQLKTEPLEITQSRTLQDSKVKGLLETKVFQLSTSLQQERERFVANSPEVTLLERHLAETRSTLQQEPDKVEVGQERILNPLHSELRQKRSSLLTQLASARATLAAKQAPLLELEKRMDQVPAITKTIVEQARIREGLELRYKLLRDRAMQAEVSRATVASAAPSVRVIDYAIPTARPIWPKNIILLPATLALGLFAGIALALLTEVLSTRVNRDRLSAHPEFPLYAVIDLRPEGPPGPQGVAQRGSKFILDRLRRAA